MGGGSLETGAGGEAGAVVIRSPGSRAGSPGHPLGLLGTSCEALETYLTALCLNLPIWEGRRVPVRINTRESLRKVPNTRYAQETQPQEDGKQEGPCGFGGRAEASFSHVERSSLR